MEQDSFPVGFASASREPRAYLTIARVSGEPERLLRGYHRTSGLMSEVGRDHGLLVHAAARTDAGLLIVNLWPSKDESEAAARDPRRLDVVRTHGLAAEDFHHDHHDVAALTIFGPSRCR